MPRRSRLPARSATLLSSATRSAATFSATLRSAATFSATLRSAATFSATLRSATPSSPTPRSASFRFAAIVLAVVASSAALSSAGYATSASAHGFTSTVYVDATSPTDGVVQVEVGLEYDLLVVSAAENENDDAFFEEGMALFETGDEAEALNAHSDTVLHYVTERLVITSAGAACEPTLVGEFGTEQREEVPYATAVIDYTCGTVESGEAQSHTISSALFADDEGYVTDTKTIVTYELDGQSASAALDGNNPSFSTEQSGQERFGEFFLLGAEHLLGGLDHILFLLALIVGSRRIRDIVLAATTFTVAHSITFLLAALGLVSVPAAVVEPIIALSIAVVALWYLWGIRSSRTRLSVMHGVGRAGTGRANRLGLGRADLLRLGVVFCFGLVHGLGFASALGIDEAWSWTLLWSLLVFNVGIEAVQLAIIALVFPLLLLLRRRAPRVGVWVSAMVAAVVALFGLVWCAERLLGVG